ncbi:MAG: Hpt domain-containing protein [Steroidobacteraceae bacterium]
MNLDKSGRFHPVESGGVESEEFEVLRQRFRQRLHKEQSRLAALTKTLYSSAHVPASSLLDIHAFAHRLRGAALVFGFQDIGDAAKALELAASAAALGANGQPPDPLVLVTAHALAQFLNDEISGGTASTPAQSTAPVAKFSS